MPSYKVPQGRGNIIGPARKRPLVRALTRGTQAKPGSIVHMMHDAYEPSNAGQGLSTTRESIRLSLKNQPSSINVIAGNYGRGVAFRVVITRMGRLVSSGSPVLWEVTCEYPKRIIERYSIFFDDELVRESTEKVSLTRITNIIANIRGDHVAWDNENDRDNLDNAIRDNSLCWNEMILSFN